MSAIGDEDTWFRRVSVGNGGTGGEHWRKNEREGAGSGATYCDL
jgi:hypothetical protein